MAIQLGSAYGKVNIDSSGVTKGVSSSVSSLKSLNSHAQELGATLRRTGAALTAAVTLPVLAAGRNAMNTFIEYEKAMNVLGAVTNATSEQMEDLSALAKELGADITLPGTSAADAAEAMAELAKAGLDVNEVMAAAKGVLQMSAAGQLGNAEAAEITANALNVFNLEGSEAVRVADLLAAAANSSSGEVRDMADALQMSASVFATAGMEIEELVTSISLMSNAGIQGSDAGTSLKQMLLSLQAPSNKAKDLMEQLGINIYDASGNMKSMREIIDIFSTQMKGLTQEERNFALATIFGSDAVRAANIVLMGGVEAYDTMLGKVTEVGAASKLAASLMEGLTGSMENLKSAFETAAIAAIEPIKDDLKVLIDIAVKLLNAFANLPAPVREAIVKFVLFLAVLGPILMVLGSLIPLIGGVTKILNPFSGGIFGLVGTFVKLIGVAALVVKVLTALGIATGPVGAAILSVQAAIAGVGASLLSIIAPILLIIGTLAFLYWAFKTNFGGIRTTAEQLWFILKYIFTQGWQMLIQVSQQRAQQLLSAIRSLVERIKSAIRNIDWAQVGKYILMGLANGMLGGIPLVVQAAQKAAQAALQAIKRTLGIASDSKEAIKLGKYTYSGFATGIEQMAAMKNPDMIARAFAKPVQNTGGTQQQNITMQFASGLTIRQVERMLAENNELMLKRLDRALGGA